MRDMRDINRTHCCQPLTAKQEDVGLHEKSGLRDIIYNIFTACGDKCCFFVVYLKGTQELETMCYTIWKVLLLACDKRQSCAAPRQRRRRRVEKRLSFVSRAHRELR